MVLRRSSTFNHLNSVIGVRWDLASLATTIYKLPTVGFLIPKLTFCSVPAVIILLGVDSGGFSCEAEFIF